MAQNVKIAINARDNASKHFKKAGMSARGFGSTIKGVAGALGAYLGARKLLSFAKESVQLFNVQDQAVQSLTDSLRLLKSESEVPQMERFASQLQKLTTYGDEATLELMQLGVSMGHFTGDTLKSATVASMGLADALKIDTASAMKLVAKASTGDTGSLSRYGIVLDATMTKEEKFSELLRIGAENFEVSKGKTKTFGGMVTQLGNSWGDAKERLGSFIATNTKVQAGIQFTQVLIENFGTAMNIVWTGTALGMVSFGENIKHIFGTVVPSYTKYFFENWKNVLSNLWNMYKSFFSNMITNWKNFFKALMSYMRGDGFDFQWTGLLDGFESTLKEMPNIAKRVASPVEQALMEELSGHKAKFKDALEAKLNGVQLDTSDLIANAKATGILDTSKGADSTKKSGLSAVESRFLSGRTISKDYAQDTAKNTQKVPPLLSKIADRIGELNTTYKNIAKNSVITESNFA